jgi:hypothetical protein
VSATKYPFLTSSILDCLTKITLILLYWPKKTTLTLTFLLLPKKSQVNTTQIPPLLLSKMIQAYPFLLWLLIALHNCLSLLKYIPQSLLEQPEPFCMIIVDCSRKQKICINSNPPRSCALSAKQMAEQTVGPSTKIQQMANKDTNAKFSRAPLVV